MSSVAFLSDRNWVMATLGQFGPHTSYRGAVVLMAGGVEIEASQIASANIEGKAVVTLVPAAMGIVEREALDRANQATIVYPD